MKNTIKMRVCATVLALSLSSNLTYAQLQRWNVGGVAPWILRLRPAQTISGVAVGEFTTPTLAALHVNTNLMPSMPVAQRGEVFRTDAPAGLTAWRMFSANVAANEKFALFNPNASSSVILQATQNDGRMTFNTGNGLQRMLITDNNSTLFGGAISNPGFVGIGPVPGRLLGNPGSMLHIGRNTTGGGLQSGWRDWMVVGTYYGTHSDNAYMGVHKTFNDLQNEHDGQNTQSDVVINWGNNPTGNEADRLRFVFTMSQGAAGFNARDYEGLEIARMITDGNMGRMGIGGNPAPATVAPHLYSGGNVDPQNTLEVNSPSTVLGSTFSGLRFTDVNNTVLPPPNPTIGVLSLNNLGDVIWVQDAGANYISNNGITITGTTIELGQQCNVPTAGASLTQDREIPLANHNFTFSETISGTGKVGIGNIATPCVPGNTLEVSTNGTTPNSTGKSGLRLTDLKSGAGTASSNGRVLSVDPNGDVILVPDAGGTGITQAANGVSINPGNANEVNLGNSLGFNTAQLVSHREIPMNGFNVSFWEWEKIPRL